MTVADIVVVVSSIFLVGFFFFGFLFFCFFVLGGGRRSLLLDLNLHIRHGSTSATEVSLGDAGVLEVVVGDGRLDGVLCKHRAMHYNNR